MGAHGVEAFDIPVPSDDFSTFVDGGAGLSASSHIEAWFQREAAGDNGADEHEEAAAMCPLACQFNSGTLFQVYAKPIGGLMVGHFQFHWAWN